MRGRLFFIRQSTVVRNEMLDDPYRNQASILNLSIRIKQESRSRQLMATSEIITPLHLYVLYRLEPHFVTSSCS